MEILTCGFEQATISGGPFQAFLTVHDMSLKTVRSKEVSQKFTVKFEVWVDNNITHTYKVELL